MLFFGIRKTSFDGFFPAFIPFFMLFCVAQFLRY
ncbi:hypothetical protein NT07LI_4149, partial [Listeria innocua FSL S4-378]